MCFHVKLDRIIGYHFSAPDAILGPGEYMIRVTDSISLNENEIQLDFIRSSGPGGQNVNKVSSAVQLRFDTSASSALTDEVRSRLKQLAGRRMTAEGILIIEARRYRNREDAIGRLVALIGRAAEKPRQRRRSKPPTAAKQKRLRAKKQRGEVKRRRSRIRISTEDT